MLREKELKDIMDCLWLHYTAAEQIINTFADIGLIIEPGTVDSHGRETAFSRVYMIQDSVSSVLKKLLGIMDDGFIPEMDNFLAERYSEYPDPGPFPEDLYAELVHMLAGYGAAVMADDTVKEADIPKAEDKWPSHL